MASEENTHTNFLFFANGENSSRENQYIGFFYEIFYRNIRDFSSEIVKIF